MPTELDYRETNRKTITVNMETVLYESILTRHGTRPDKVTSAELRDLIMLYLSGHYPKGSVKFKDARKDLNEMLNHKTVSFMVSEPTYIKLVACAKAHRKPLVAIVRASLREIFMDFHSPYRSHLLGT